MSSLRTTAVFVVALMVVSASAKKLKGNEDEDFPTTGIAAAVFTWIDHILIWTFPYYSVCLPAIGWTLDFLVQSILGDYETFGG